MYRCYMLSGDLEHLGQGNITATFKAIGAEGWKLAVGHIYILLSFYSSYLKIWLKWIQKFYSNELFYITGSCYPTKKEKFKVDSWISPRHAI